MGMFDAPKTVEAPAKKAAKSTKAEVEIKGIEHLSMIDALQKTLETLRGTIEGEVKAVALTRFMEHIAATGQRPESFKGIEGGASATLTMSRKGSTTAISDAHADLLRSNGLEPVKLVVTPELFAINPAYAGDKALLGKVEKALAKIVPADFIMLQEEKSKLVVTEDTLNQAISQKSPVEVIQTMTSLSCSPKLLNTDIGAILKFVTELIDAPVFGKAADEAKAAKLTLVKAA
jgi:hypothetical protein